METTARSTSTSGSRCTWPTFGDESAGSLGLYGEIHMGNDRELFNSRDTVPCMKDVWWISTTLPARGYKWAWSCCRMGGPAVGRAWISQPRGFTPNVPDRPGSNAAVSVAHCAVGGPTNERTDTYLVPPNVLCGHSVLTLVPAVVSVGIAGLDCSAQLYAMDFAIRSKILNIAVDHGWLAFPRPAPDIPSSRRWLIVACACCAPAPARSLWE